MPPHFLDHASKPQHTDRVLLGLVDFGLIVALLAVPMMLGGNHALGRFTLVLAASCTATVWAVRQTIRCERFLPGTWALVLLGVGLLIPIVQLVPLPETVRNLLSPELAKILPLWQSNADEVTRLGVWPCLSLYPAVTKAGLIIFAAYSMLFIVVAGRVQTIHDLRRLLQWCGVVVLVVAVFAIVQHFFGNGKFFWFYEHPYNLANNSIKGPFLNRNHFAQFMALGIGPILVWIVMHTTSSSHTSHTPHASSPSRTSHSLRTSPPSHTSRKRSVTPSESETVRHRFDYGPAPKLSRNEVSTKAGQFLLAMMAGVVMFACLLSLSRGGSMAMLLATLVCCGVSFTVKGANRKMFGAILMAGIILGGSLMIFGYKKVCDRLGNLTSGKVELMDADVGRRAIWKTDLQISAQFPILGTGVGSHREVYQILFDHVHYDNRVFSHAENGYVQTLLETGGTGALVLFGAIGLVAFWCVDGLRRSRSDQLRLCLAGISASIIASLFHSMTDFIWYIPGCASMTVILAACAFCAHRLALREAAEAHAQAIQKPLAPSPATGSATGVLSGKRSPAIGLTGLTGSSERSLASERLKFRVGNWAAVGVMLLLTFIMIDERLGPLRAEPYWNEHLRAECASKYHDVTLDLLSREELGEVARFFIEQIERLQKVVRYQPDNAEAHRKLTMNCLNLFDIHQIVGENPFSIRHIADAVIQSRSELPTKEAVYEWLQRAFGDQVSLLKLAQYHARCSVNACPLSGSSYLNLVELSFLDNLTFEQKMRMVDQILLVRPRCSNSVLEWANHAVLSGYFEQWVELSRRVYRMNLDARNTVLRQLIEDSQTEMLPVMIAILIQQFEPDHEAALYMISLCQKRIPETQLVDLRRYCIDQALANLEPCDPSEKAHRRYVAAMQYRKLGESETALAQLRAAYDADPNLFEVRYSLAELLIKLGSPQEAKIHIQWCDRRKPGNKSIEKMYHAALAADRAPDPATAAGADATADAQARAKNPPTR